MIKGLAYGTAILALDTVFNKEMLQNGKFGLFFKKNHLSVRKMIDYCEKEESLIEKYRLNSVRGITDKYDWNKITDQYLDVFKSLVQKRD